MEKRVKSSIYLLGSYESKILGAKLPSYRQAFGFFLHLHQVEKKTVRNASRQAIQVVSTFWEKAGIPLPCQHHSIQKLEKVFTEWKSLRKHSTRSTAAHKLKEDEFVERLDDLFDIAHGDALSLIKIPEDKEFLIFQKMKGRPGAMGALDMVQQRRIKKTEDRLNAEERRRKIAKQETEASSSRAVLASDSSTSSIAAEDIEEDEEDPSGSPVAKRARINIMSSQLASALDRTKISSRNATFVLGEVATSHFMFRLFMPSRCGSFVANSR